jgi:hypothetical protein
MKSLFLLVGLVLFLVNADLAEVRKLYPKASVSEGASNEFAIKLSSVDQSSDKTLLAYKGASITLLCKYIKKPAERLTKFKDGAKLIEMAVKSEPNNIEIRLIRLSVQENVPNIVKYKSNLKEDAAFLLAHYNQSPPAVKSYIKSFIAQSKSFTEQEKLSIK